MTKHDQMCRMATGASEVFCDCDLIWRVMGRERTRTVTRMQVDARKLMEAARNAAKYEAWETAATLRIKATALRDHAALVEEAA